VGLVLARGDGAVVGRPAGSGHEPLRGQVRGRADLLQLADRTVVAASAAGTSKSMAVATSAATRSGRRTAACAANVAPNENPATKLFLLKRACSSSSISTASSTIAAAVISALLRLGSAD